VETPPQVVSLFWRVIKTHRPSRGRVLDLGAGNGRFSFGGNYSTYDGIEIDPSSYPPVDLPPGATIYNGCAFDFPGGDYDLCVGNPPYVRHHDIESPWKEIVADWIKNELGTSFDLHGNLYLYFLSLGLIKTREDGLVGMIIPYEWISRPSAKGLRTLINRANWDVSVYRFKMAIFPTVQTTACISIIDKSQKNGRWHLYDIDENHVISTRKGLTGTEFSVLPHDDRGQIWAKRGLSPGSQKVFTLTEGERVHFGLTKTDVKPCVTTLKHLPKDLRELNHLSFKKHFVESGRKCWLIKSNSDKISHRLKSYLESVPETSRQTWTCLNQDPWYNYEPSNIPDILVHSAFVKFGPKVLVNNIGAEVVGSVYGVFLRRGISARKLRDYLLEFNFEDKLVHHSNRLKKIEVRQLNSVLSNWIEGNGG
jgi:hypothetical protein